MEYLLNLITFLGGGSLLAMTLVNLFKKTVTDTVGKYGKLTTLSLLLVVSLLISLIAYGLNFLPVDFIVAIASIFGGAIFFYESIWKLTGGIDKE